MLSYGNASIYTVCQRTSIFFSSAQTRSRSSPVPVPDMADIGKGDNLINILKDKLIIHICKTIPIL